MYFADLAKLPTVSLREALPEYIEFCKVDYSLFHPDFAFKVGLAGPVSW